MFASASRPPIFHEPYRALRLTAATSHSSRHEQMVYPLSFRYLAARHPSNPCRRASVLVGSGMAVHEICAPSRQAKGPVHHNGHDSLRCSTLVLLAFSRNISHMADVKSRRYTSPWQRHVNTMARSLGQARQVQQFSLSSFVWRAG